MILAILITQFILGGTAYHIATHTYNAILDFLEVKNWLTSGYVTHYDYEHCNRRLIHWCAISLAYLIAYATCIYISVILLSTF